jgi:hypothetical protein
MLDKYDSRAIIKLLKLIPTNNITKLQCQDFSFHSSFLIDLVQIIRHIRELTLEHVEYKADLIEHRGKNKTYKKVLTAQIAITHVQLYYKDLMHLYLYMSSFSERDNKICKAHKQLQTWLNGKKQQKKFYISCQRHRRNYEHRWNDDDNYDYPRYIDNCIYIYRQRKRQEIVFNC